ncbi:MAG: RagB/SusD family nutrient uptake outer membrane protein [Alistipes senegalensis]|nr:RagB/SusD family nutrient uptake outer membrane protein [Alistipes senegalensis]
MKKLLYSISALLVMGGLATSCLDDALEVEPQSTFDASIVYSTYQLAEYSVIGIGEIFAHTNSYNARLNHMYGYNTDIELKMGSKASGAKVEEYTLSEYDTQINNGSLNTANNGYNEIMIGIERANLAIQGLRQYGNTANDPDMAYLLGEALTYRALYYYELIKMWGEVPLHLEPLTSETLYDPKSDRDDLYAAMLADLDEASEYLYWPYEATQTMRADRMNKAFAKGLYARIALNAAGYSWRPEDGKVGTGDPGSLRTSNREDMQKSVLYPKAMKHLQDIIASGSLSLDSDFESLWRKFNDFSHVDASREVMFVQPFGNSRGRWNYAHAYPHTANSPFIADKSSKGGATGPNPTLWWKYLKQDTRRDITCVPMRWNQDANDKQGGWEMRNASSFYWGKYRYEWMIDYPGGTGDGCKPIVMRYADVYLMAAEIAAWEGDLEAAKGYLATVRKRAYKGNEGLVDTYVNALTIGSAAGSDDAAINDFDADNTIMKAIIDERALEFAGEFLRKQDLIRWGLLKEKMDEASKDMKSLAMMQGEYAEYAKYTEPKEFKNSKGDQVLATFDTYYVYWREKGQGIETYGLEKDEIGKVPAGYNGKEDDGGWNRLDFLSQGVFYQVSSANSTVDTYNDEMSYRWKYFYNNSYNDPYPRSTWPLFGLNLSNSQGSLVNDFGYENL